MKICIIGYRLRSLKVRDEFHAIILYSPAFLKRLCHCTDQQVHFVLNQTVSESLSHIHTEKNGFDHLSHCFLCVYNSFRSIWLHSLNWYFWFLLHIHCTFSFVLCNFYKQRHLLTYIYNSRYHRNPLQPRLYPYVP